PRLDWQFWFAAYRSPRQSRWTIPFTRRLLKGSDQVEALLAETPFKGQPPEYVRIRRYEYRFSRPYQLRNGTWWTVSGGEPYLPPVTLRNGELVRADN
ncbi:MAG: lipase maturation factor family protein, partial [Candidatus Nanohaloarchaea archaeon]